LSHGEKLSQVTPEYAEMYIYKRGLLARKAKKEGYQEWYEEDFIPFLQTETQEAINSVFFGDHQKALRFLHEKIEDDTHKQVWTEINDHIRLALGENEDIEIFLGEENIEHALGHEHANGLNRTIKKMINALIILEEEYENKQSVSDDESLEETNKDLRHDIRVGLSRRGLENALRKYGFVFLRFANSAHIEYGNKEGKKLIIPKRTLEGRGLRYKYVGLIRNMILQAD
jgi:hypothetical protein